MAFTASMLFGYTINCMGIIFSEMNNRKYAYEKKFTEINRFFKDHNVELGLQIRAKKYLEFIENEGLTSSPNSVPSQCLDFLSPFL